MKIIMKKQPTSSNHTEAITHQAITLEVGCFFHNNFHVLLSWLSGHIYYNTSCHCHHNPLLKKYLCRNDRNIYVGVTYKYYYNTYRSKFQQTHHIKVSRIIGDLSF